MGEHDAVPEPRWKVRRIHLRKVGKSADWTACGQFRNHTGYETTDDPAQVTCGHCRKWLLP